MRDWFHRWFAPAALVAAAGPIPCFAATYLSVEQAQKLCFPSATKFAPEALTLNAAQVQAVEKESGVKVRRPAVKVWRAFAGEEFLGWFFEDEVAGKHDVINWVLALDPSGAVLRVEILAYREAYGYEVREEKWRAQFVGKRRGAPLTLDADIKNISGATISCRRLTEGVKRLLATYAVALKH